MILLHQLRTQNFKQLTDLALCFPERGTVLIEGLNEAGKSSLFEAVFFALYGRTLSRDQDYGVRHLKTYHAEEMRVELDFSIDGRPFTISRRVVANQRASLTCPAGDGRTESFTGIRPIEQRLREELRLTPEALLNTCFVEQKGLERLESLQADQRRETVNELLNLRILSRLDEAYRISGEDRQALVTQRRRVEIAALDADIPDLQAAERIAARCLLYSRILECERQIRQLDEQTGQAAARQAEIAQRRSEIGALLRQVEQLQARLKAIDADLPLRVRAWAQALGLLAAAEEELRKLEALAAALPAREARLAAWEELGRRLAELEDLEATASRHREEVRQAEDRLARCDAAQGEWDAGEAGRARLQAALDAKQAEVGRADAALRERVRGNQRCERLTLLLQHTVAAGSAQREAANLAARIETARRTAGRLGEHRSRLRELEALEERLRRREEDLRELRRAESDLAAAERERDSLRERQARIEALEAELSRLEACRDAVEAGERAAVEEVRRVEARIALADWAAAAERCAESDPDSGRLADLDRREKEALARLEQCRAGVRRAAGTLRLAAAAAVGGLLLGVGGAAAQQIATVGVAGLVLLLAGLVLAWTAGRKLGIARGEEAAGRKTCDGLEGERRAIERETRAAAADHQRRQAREAECRDLLRRLAVAVPGSLAEAHRMLAGLPETPAAAARQALEEARRRAAAWRNDREVARRSLDAERARPAADPVLIERRAEELAAGCGRLRAAIQQAGGPEALEEHGIEDAAGLKAVLEEARARVSESAAAERSIPELEAQRAEKAGLAASELEAARVLAEEAGLAGDDPAAWAAAAQSERARHLQAAAAVPDAALQSSVDEAREAAAAARQELTRLEAAQEQRRRELDRQPRASLVEDLRSRRAALAAVEAGLAPLSEVRPNLESAGLPVQSSDLRPRLAVLRGDLERDGEEAAALAERRAACDRRAAEAAERAAELGAAWQALPGERAPASPDAALERLAEVRVSGERELAALAEASLRAEDEDLRRESAALDRQQAARAHDRSRSKARQEGLLAELGVEPGAAVDPLPIRFPELSATGERDSEAWSEELERRREAVRANRADRRARADTLSLGEAPLDLALEREALARMERDLAVRRRAAQIVTKTREAIVNRVMPLTMQNMRQILPLLTEGRYQDVEWDEQNNVISVYDIRAGSFQRKRVFSGGARDQISLALRLAFALATLPGEHNVRPGWLFLDEPLSSFDHARTEALVDLLTRGLVRKQFAQIFLISHSRSFDPGRFDYRIRMDAGRVVESSLPARVPAA